MKIYLSPLAPVSDDIFLLGLLALILAFMISFMAYPVIIYLVKAKQLMDMPDGRSSHKDKVPTLGGVGVFVALALTLGIVGSVIDHRNIPFNPLPLTAGMTLLFFLGV